MYLLPLPVLLSVTENTSLISAVAPTVTQKESRTLLGKWPPLLSEMCPLPFSNCTFKELETGVDAVPSTLKTQL